MITKKTLFILGAGASMPYGLPSGAQLRNLICGLKGENELSRILAADIDIPRDDLMEFATVFQRSRQISIDAFLAKRDDKATFGKLCIAAALSFQESDEALNRLGIEDDWYQTLWNAMQADVHAALDLSSNSVRFITFNYDRSLESFLHTSVKNSYGVSDEEAYKAWKPISILHVYGLLGEFHWARGEKTRTYGEPMDIYGLQLAARSLKVIPEAREDADEFKLARAWIEWAEQVCFLGFGFDSLNMERLGIDSVLSSLQERGKPLPWIVASTFGMTVSEAKRIQSKYFSPGAGCLMLQQKSQMVLRESGLLG